MKKRPEFPLESYHVGDTVMYASDKHCKNKQKPQYGEIAVIRVIDGQALGLEFERESSAFGSCDGAVKKNRGWWCYPDHITKYDDFAGYTFDMNELTDF